MANKKKKTATTNAGLESKLRVRDRIDALLNGIAQNAVNHDIIEQVIQLLCSSIVCRGESRPPIPHVIHFPLGSLDYDLMDDQLLL